MKKSIAIVGGGSSALFLASNLNNELFDVTIYERNKNLARKFLVAGKGGFNLSHSEPIDELIGRYTPNDFLSECLRAHDNVSLRTWYRNIGIPTFIGSSKRIFPELEIKPIEVLNAIVSELKDNGVGFKFEHNWSGWDEAGKLIFENQAAVDADVKIFCLGGSSWKITGSDGLWLDNFKKHKIPTKKFQASNCAFEIDWKPNFIKNREGEPLKNIAISCNSKSIKGEVIITKFGLEGNAIYALSPEIRNLINKDGQADITIDLKPSLTLEKVLEKMSNSKFDRLTDILRKSLNLSRAQISLLKSYTDKETFLNQDLLAHAIKNLALQLKSAAPLDDGISTVGGIALNAVDKNFELKGVANNFCIGEMLDWDAPTGGYLLQACYSMGLFLSEHVNHRYK